MTHDRLCGMNFDAECTCLNEAAEVSESTLNDLLCLRVRKVGETMRCCDVVLFDEMFMPLGFATHCGHYFAAQIVTTSMTGKVVCKTT